MTRVRLPAPAEIAENADYFELFGGAVRGWQALDGYRFSIDAILLAMAAFDAPGERVLELGSGVGIVLLALAVNPRFRELVGLEIQPEMAAYARYNAALSHPSERVRVMEGDLRSPPAALAERRFDIVVSNPPYYPLSTGHVNPDGQRAVARHEVTCCLDDVLRQAREFVTPQGRVFLVYPAPREKAVLEAAPKAQLDVTTVQLIRSRHGYEPRQVLFELRPTTQPPLPCPLRIDLDLHDESGDYQGAIGDFMKRLERLARSDHDTDPVLPRRGSPVPS